MPDDFQDALRSITDSLVAGMTAESDAQMADIAPVIQQFVERGPDAFNNGVLFPLGELLDAGIRRAFPHVPQDRLNKLEFLFAHADFVSHHLDQRIKDGEGWACSFDKVLWILNHYAMWLGSGNAIPTLPEPRQFFHPKSMTVEFWFGCCDHLQGLYYGKPQWYLEDLTLLLADRGITRT